MKRLLPIALLLPSVALAAPPPANVPMANGTFRAVTPTAIVDGNGDQVTTFGGSGGSGGAVTAAANSYSTGFSPDVGKIADIAYTDLTGQASGGLVAVNKAQLVRIEAERALLSSGIGLPVGAATQATLAAISGQLPASLAAKAAALSLSVVPALGTTSTTVSGTITTANTYQSALASNANRRGCLVQNKSVNLERVFLGVPGSATDATSIDVPAGSTFNCASPGGFVLTDQLSISSATATSAYLVISQ